MTELQERPRAERQAKKVARPARRDPYDDATVAALLEADKKGPREKPKSADDMKAALRQG